MKRSVLATYRYIFARKRLYGFNKLIFRLSLSGLGILNYENGKVSGEDRFLWWLGRTMNDPLVLDIGANTGEYSNKVKSLCPNATIYAFEPHPKTFALLREQARGKGYVAINAACGETEGQSRLYDYEGNDNGSSHASLYREVIEDIHGNKARFSTVDITTVDDFASRNSIDRINLLKIDVEGNELRVVKGARACISAGLIDVIQFEFNEMNVVSKSFFRDFYNALPGYGFYRMLPNGLVPLGSYNPLMCELFAYQNVVAVHESRRNPVGYQ